MRTPEIPTHAIRRTSRGPSSLLCLIALVGLALAGAACADSGDDTTSGGASRDGADPTAAPEPGRYVVTSVTGYTPVEGVEIEVTLEEGRVAASGGCNRIMGEYRVEDGALVVGPLASTRMACEQDVMDQDQWLIGFLESGPTVEVTGGSVSLTADGTTVVLAPAAD